MTEELLNEDIRVLTDALPAWMWSDASIAPTPELFEVAAAVLGMAAWLDRHDDRPAHARQGLRVLKLAEETGETVAAWIGATGQNPRKGITARAIDVARELADVTFSALTALVSVGGDAAEALTDALMSWGWIVAGEDAGFVSADEVNEWLLRVTRDAGEVCAAFLLDPGPDRDQRLIDHLNDVVVDACNGIAQLGFDPNEVLSGTARVVAGRVLSHPTGPHTS
ncbi:MazG-like family protein [Cryptosporangium phraense]|uniref:MazG-like family protein n=1 Tax=Cryptosporangium phraense TaxID=2593070 RepID=UPI00197AFF05|nr:MazG-like family protein [Cryptosporangium phraense]